MVQLPAGVEREIIVVDDGSTDGTTLILRTIEDSTVRVIKHASNLGQGAAVKAGLEVATGDYVLIQDADLEYDPTDIPRLLAPIMDGSADVVYGNRYHAQNSAMKLTSFIADRSLSLLASLLYNKMLIDVETGSRAFSRRALDAVNISGDRFEFSTELTAKLLRVGARFLEVPVNYNGRISNKRSRRDRLATASKLVAQRFSRKNAKEIGDKSGSVVVDIRDGAKHSITN